ncbi:heparan-alpha-glucosaminide N-acetyltransferase domain-containing protein [Microbacterium sp.]|uniref:heparan-alpha-glucosaminide N-acetyltransferase domain-containing protein n=1 Tax=Microbacterium sp. TaxID=51671 RepID=UPI003A89925E
MAAAPVATGAFTSWNGPGRVQGIDLARGLAVLGMFAAHLLWIDPFQPADPATWFDVANGRSSILFATLAGVSLALATGAERPFDGARMRRARVAVAVRAVIVWLVGVALISTGVPLVVILPAYAILFLLAIPLLTGSVRALWWLAAGLAVTTPWLVPLWNAMPLWWTVEGEVLADAIGWHYPFPLWLAFLAAGLAVGRSHLLRIEVQVRLLVGGALVAAGGYGAAALFAWPGDTYFAAVWSAEAHSSGLGEAIGSGSFAVAVIAASLLICRTPLTWVLLPVRAVGTMPLTAYVGQVVAWAIWAQLALGDTGDIVGMRALAPFGPFALVTLAGCTIWAVWVGRGPLERVVAAVTGAVAARAVGSRRGPR